MGGSTQDPGLHIRYVKPYQHYTVVCFFVENREENEGSCGKERRKGEEKKGKVWQLFHDLGVAE